MADIIGFFDTYLFSDKKASKDNGIILKIGKTKEFKSYEEIERINCSGKDNRWNKRRRV